MKTLHKLIKDDVFTFNGIQSVFLLLVHEKLRFQQLWVNFVYSCVSYWSY